MKIEKIVKKFLDQHADPERPLLCALSGGVDSLCLFHLLKNCAKLTVAHVDHGWRDESAEEAEALRALADSYKIPFYLKVLDSDSLAGNLEDACRQERIGFFVECAREIGAQAVILGHHADDQAETVLKRVFEGAFFDKISGMKPTTLMRGVPFWRPLLTISKKEIVEWMTGQGFEWMEDVTNLDSRYLRARMRHSLIPQLNQEFGKNVAQPLCRLASELEEVEGYLKRAVVPYRPQKIMEETEICYDFSQNRPSDLLEWKVLVREVCESESFSLSRSQLTDLVRLLHEMRGNKWVESGGKKVKIDRGRLIFSRPNKKICCHDIGGGV